MILALAALLLALAGCSSPREDAAAEAALAQQLLQEGRIAEARLAIQRAIKEDDSEPAYHILSGRIEFRAGATLNAFKAYDNARSLDATNIEALQAVAQLGLETGYLRQSLEATETILALDPQNTDALTVRGLHAIAGRKYDEADDYADRLLAVDPVNEGGTILKARVAYLAGDTATARRLLDNFVAAKERTQGIALTGLEIDREVGDEAGMAAQFEVLREFMPENHSLRIDEANFEFKRGNRSQAIALSSTPLLDNQVAPDIVRGAVSLWREFGVTRLDPAFVQQLAAQGSRPTLRLVGEFLADNNVPGAAQVAAKLSEAEGLALLAHASFAVGDTEAARQNAERALAIDTQNCMALTVRAQLKLDSDPKGALRDAQEATGQCPNSINGWIAGATAYDWVDDEINARRVWRQGVAENEQNTRLASAYTRWLRGKDRDREALTVGRKLTVSAPALVSGWELYSQLCRSVPASRCSADAQRGLSAARTRYAIDLLPGEAAPRGLFGRIDPR